MPRPPETTTRAEVSSGRSELDSLAAEERRRARLAPTAATVAIVGAAAFGRGRSKVVVRTVITSLGVRALHRRQGVAGIDRAHEGVGPDHRRRCR